MAFAYCSLRNRIPEGPKHQAGCEGWKKLGQVDSQHCNQRAEEALKAVQRGLFDLPTNLPKPECPKSLLPCSQAIMLRVDVLTRAFWQQGACIAGRESTAVIVLEWLIEVGADLLRASSTKCRFLDHSGGLHARQQAFCDHRMLWSET